MRRLDVRRRGRACGPRRLVKRNDLLFDLIRGCDLTRISAIGWRDWHRGREGGRSTRFLDGFGPRVGDEQQYVTKRLLGDVLASGARKTTVGPTASR